MVLGTTERPAHLAVPEEERGRNVFDVLVERGFVAQVVHRPEHPFRHALDLVYVDQIAVDPAHRRRGYGARLLREAVALAQAAGIRRVELDVWAFNAGARRFFAGQGFGVFNERMELETGREA